MFFSLIPPRLPARLAPRHSLKAPELRVALRAHLGPSVQQRLPSTRFPLSAYTGLPQSARSRGQGHVLTLLPPSLPPHRLPNPSLNKDPKGPSQSQRKSDSGLGVSGTSLLNLTHTAQKHERRREFIRGPTSSHPRPRRSVPSEAAS